MRREPATPESWRALCWPIYPGHNLRVFNRGISGNRLLGRRWSPSLPCGACPNGSILAIKSGHLTANYEMDVMDSGGRDRRLGLKFVSVKKNVADWRWRAFQQESTCSRPKIGLLVALEGQFSVVTHSC